MTPSFPGREFILYSSPCHGMECDPIASGESGRLSAVTGRWVSHLERRWDGLSVRRCSKPILEPELRRLLLAASGVPAALMR